MHPIDQEITDVADSEEEEVAHVSSTELAGQRTKVVDLKRKKVQATRGDIEDEEEGVGTSEAVASREEPCSEEALRDPVAEEWEEA